jgi:hypothetical protein
MGRWSARRAKDLTAFAGIEIGDRVLDVCCGTSSVALTLAARSRPAVHSVCLGAVGGPAQFSPRRCGGSGFARRQLRRLLFTSGAQLHVRPALGPRQHAPGDPRGRRRAAVWDFAIWPTILERFRRATLGATLLRCTGKLQREESVIHVVAERLDGLTPRLRTLRDSVGDDAPGHVPRPAFASSAKTTGL